jgi:hypothetical protein
VRLRSALTCAVPRAQYTFNLSPSLARMPGRRDNYER